MPEERKIGSHYINPGKKCWRPEAGHWQTLGWRGVRADMDLGDGVDGTWMQGCREGREESRAMPGTWRGPSWCLGWKAADRASFHQLLCPGSRGQVMPKTCCLRPFTEEAFIIRIPGHPRALMPGTGQFSGEVSIMTRKKVAALSSFSFLPSLCKPNSSLLFLPGGV